ncbi:hypothetical protein ANTRET_LOCUS4256, partial [Anthophora retusa]
MCKFLHDRGGRQSVQCLKMSAIVELIARSEFLNACDKNEKKKEKRKKRDGVAWHSSAEFLQSFVALKAKKAANELGDIDLTDPDLHKAATKIQASFRGHKVRQEVSNPPHNEEPKK